jgi:flagellar biosynthesis/type III secretory pathway M-ring protein FliF/YscJ
MSDDKSRDDKRLAYLARLKGEPVPAAPAEPGPDNLPAGKGPTIEIEDFHANTSLSAGKKINGFSARVGTDTVKRIGEVVDENPDKALAIFRAWMSQ